MPGFLKRQWKKLLIGGVAVAVIGGITYSRTSGTKETFETVSASRGTVIEEVSVTGSIAPVTKVALQPQVGGRVQEVLVTEGDKVTAGDVLVRIAASDIAAQIAGQRAAMEAALARLRELQAGATDAELALSRAAVSSAQTKLDAANAALQDADMTVGNAQRTLDNANAKAATLLASKYAAIIVELDESLTTSQDAIERLTEGVYTSDDQLALTSNDFSAATNAVNTRAAAKNALVAMQTTVVSAKANQTTDVLLSAGATVLDQLATVKAHLSATAEVLKSTIGVSSTTLATYQANANLGVTNLNLAIQGLTAARSDLDLQTKLNAAETTSAEIALSDARSALTTASYGVESAQRALAQAQAELDLKLTGARPEAIAAQRAQVHLAEANVAASLAEYDKRSIVAPFDAIVTQVDVEQGETITASLPAVTVQSQGRFEIIANISEIDIAKLTVGDPVDITLDAFSRDEHWSGRVITIQPAEKVVEGIIFYETTVVFDIDDERLRSGMTANLTIETDRREDVVTVPYRALRGGNGDTYVEVLRGGMPEERRVTVGLEGLQDVEIVEGVSEGDVVIVSRSGE